jgi:hypothetical protein
MPAQVKRRTIDDDLPIRAAARGDALAAGRGKNRRSL